MTPSQIYRKSPAPETCLCQGEILSGLVRYRIDTADMNATNQTESSTERGLIRFEYAYAVVISQQCDLEQDFKSRQTNMPQLPDVMFCQVPTAEVLKASCGGSDIWKRIKQNKDERYHFLELIPGEYDACGEGLPELGIDFKRYFTIPTDEVYLGLRFGTTRRRSVLCNPYSEHLSSRFAYFLSRVALPRDHHST